MSEMTPDRKQELQQLFFGIMSLGFSMGLQHPMECFYDYTRHLPNLLPYPEVPAEYDRAVACMALFFRSSSCGPEDDEAQQQLTDREVVRRAATHYDAYAKYQWEQMKIKIKEEEEQERAKRNKRDSAADTCRV